MREWLFAAIMGALFGGIYAHQRDERHFNEKLALATAEFTAATTQCSAGVDQQAQELVRCNQLLSAQYEKTSIIADHLTACSYRRHR